MPIISSSAEKEDQVQNVFLLEPQMRLFATMFQSESNSSLIYKNSSLCKANQLIPQKSFEFSEKRRSLRKKRKYFKYAV